MIRFGNFIIGFSIETIVFCDRKIVKKIKSLPSILKKDRRDRFTHGRSFEKIDGRSFEKVNESDSITVDLFLKIEKIEDRKIEFPNLVIIPECPVELLLGAAAWGDVDSQEELLQVELV